MTGGCPEELATLVLGWSGREVLPEVVARRQGGRNAYPEVSSEAVGEPALRVAGKRAKHASWPEPGGRPTLRT